jgi:hypothetical protein
VKNERGISKLKRKEGESFPSLLNYSAAQAVPAWDFGACLGSLSGQNLLKRVKRRRTVSSSAKYSMDITEWYGLALAGLVTLYFLIRNLRFAIASNYLRRKQNTLVFYFLKYFFYPQIHNFVRGKSKLTNWEAVLIVLFLSGNVFSMFFMAESSDDLRKRAALLSLINAIPLYAGGRVNGVTQYFGLTKESVAQAHRWFGRISIIEALVHCIFGLHSLNQLNEIDRISVFTVSRSFRIVQCIITP